MDLQIADPFTADNGLECVLLFNGDNCEIEDCKMVHVQIGPKSLLYIPSVLFFFQHHFIRTGRNQPQNALFSILIPFFFHQNKGKPTSKCFVFNFQDPAMIEYMYVCLYVYVYIYIYVYIYMYIYEYI